MTKIGFIGAGQMATALALGFLNAKAVLPENLFASDVDPSALKRFTTSAGASACRDNQGLVEKSDVVFLAVKPQQIHCVLEEIAKINTSGKLYVTIVAGIPISVYEKHLGKQVKIARVMPNTPCMVAEGVCAFAVSASVTGDDIELVQSLLKTVGIAENVAENQLDAVTGLSGSGPAFVYQMIEAMSDAGVMMGLPRTMATQFAAQTLKGAAEMVLKTGEHPAVLKDRVTSPAGTTIVGIKMLEESGFRAAIINAVKAATERSVELSQQR